MNSIWEMDQDTRYCCNAISFKVLYQLEEHHIYTWILKSIFNTKAVLIKLDECRLQWRFVSDDHRPTKDNDKRQASRWLWWRLELWLMVGWCLNREWQTVVGKDDSRRQQKLVVRSRPLVWDHDCVKACWLPANANLGLEN